MLKRNCSWLFGVALIASTMLSSAHASTIVLSENFNGPGLPAGWSTATGVGAASPSLWSKPPTIVGTFASATGDNTYFQDSVGSFFEAQNTIADYLITPVLQPSTGANNVTTVSFLLRGDPAAEASFPDDLRVLFSPGTGTALTGFSTVIADINPMFTASGIPTDWTLFTFSIAGLNNTNSGRLAFEYFVDNTLVDGDQIGIDAITVTATIPEPDSLALLGLGVAAAFGFASRRRARR